MFTLMSLTRPLSYGGDNDSAKGAIALSGCNLAYICRTMVCWLRTLFGRLASVSRSMAYEGAVCCGMSQHRAQVNYCRACQWDHWRFASVSPQYKAASAPRPQCSSSPSSVAFADSRILSAFAQGCSVAHRVCCATRTCRHRVHHRIQFLPSPPKLGEVQGRAADFLHGRLLPRTQTQDRPGVPQDHSAVAQRPHRSTRRPSATSAPTALQVASTTTEY